MWNGPNGPGVRRAGQGAALDHSRRQPGLLQWDGADRTRCYLKGEALAHTFPHA